MSPGVRQKARSINLASRSRWSRRIPELPVIGMAPTQSGVAPTQSSPPRRSPRPGGALNFIVTSAGTAIRRPKQDPLNCGRFCRAKLCQPAGWKSSEFIRFDRPVSRCNGRATIEQNKDFHTVIDSSSMNCSRMTFSADGEDGRGKYH